MRESQRRAGWRCSGINAVISSNQAMYGLDRKSIKHLEITKFKVKGK